MEQFVDAFKKWAMYGSRATRSDFWWFFGVSLIVLTMLLIVDTALLSSGDRPGVQLPPGFLGAVFGLVTFLPGLALLVRRVHDVGRSGWWALLVLVPCIGSIAWLVFGLQQSEQRANQWGPLALR